MKLNWGSGIAIAYIVFVLGMILFVVKASQQDNQLVVDNYYEEAVNYQTKIDAKRNNAITGNQLEVEYLRDQNLIAIKFADHHKKISGEISFYKPDDAGKDFKQNLNFDTNGKQMISTVHLAKGTWDLKCSWKVEGTDCYKEQKIFIQ